MLVVLIWYNRNKWKNKYKVEGGGDIHQSNGIIFTKPFMFPNQMIASIYYCYEYSCYIYQIDSKLTAIKLGGSGSYEANKIYCEPNIHSDKFKGMLYTDPNGNYVKKNDNFIATPYNTHYYYSNINGILKRNLSGFETYPFVRNSSKNQIIDLNFPDATFFGDTIRFYYRYDPNLYHVSFHLCALNGYDPNDYLFKFIKQLERDAIAKIKTYSDYLFSAGDENMSLLSQANYKLTDNEKRQGENFIFNTITGILTAYTDIANYIYWYITTKLNEDQQKIVFRKLGKHDVVYNKNEKIDNYYALFV